MTCAKRFSAWKGQNGKQVKGWEARFLIGETHCFRTTVRDPTLLKGE